MDGFLKKVKKWLGKVKNTPVLGSMAEDLMTLIDLLADYRAGIYRDLPKGVFLAAAIGLGYALCPIDLILDIIPFAGYLDDAAVISLILELGLARDLMQYRDWKHRRRLDDLDRCRQSMVDRLLEAIGENELAAAYLTEDRRIRLLLAKPGDTARPLPCRTKYVPLDENELERLELSGWEQLGEFFSQLFRDSRFRWSRFGRQPFRPEYACQIDDAFVLVD